ncbi:MAG: Na/Pi cotransporter family protein [Rhodospirillaceae bacterium]|nr:Na/Pi cotransporter family protein [Rhodospirillaceae bacterium]
MMRLGKTLHRHMGTTAALVAGALLIFAIAVTAAFAKIAAGVAIFLFGMRFMENGFKAFTGGTLDTLLKRFTRGPWRSLSFGIVTTTIMQSSSLVSVITISFLSAGLIDLASGIGIVFGANLGTTSGAWLIAAFGLKVDIAAWAMPMLALGIILVLHPARSAKGAGNILAGLGFLFLGISFMKDGFDTFNQGLDIAVIDPQGLRATLLFVLFGAAATVIMQSSHATLVLILTALSSGQIGAEGAITLAVGANIGTTITAIIGAFSANIDGKRLAAAHMVFNIITGGLVITAIGPTIHLVESLSASLGIGDDATLELALFHTLFNGLGVVLLTPLIPSMIPILGRLLPTPQPPGLKPCFLTAATEAFPEPLNQALRLELIRLYDNAVEIMAHGLHVRRRILFGAISLETIIDHQRNLITIDLDNQYAERVESLSAAIIGAISRAGTPSPEQTETLSSFQDACLGIIACVKETKHLRPNLTLYIRHNNADIRTTYNEMRLAIGNALRAIDQLRKEPQEHRDTLELETLRVHFTQNDPTTNGRLDTLIREGRITPHMGMSLMNDLRYTRSVVWALVDIGRTLFGEIDTTHSAAERVLGLSDADISRIARGPS